MVSIALGYLINLVLRCSFFCCSGMTISIPLSDISIARARMLYNACIYISPHFITAFLPDFATAIAYIYIQIIQR